MFCAISGEPPKVPVVSRKSGLVYEQRLIQKYIDENGKDPVTGDTLELDDLIEIKASPKTAVPRPPQHSSIPSLLTSLQNEYDAIILETFTLKKHYDNLRQELAHALYANDASARVIARLLNERDQAREALASIQGTIGAGPSRPDQDVDMAESTEKSNGSSVPASIASLIESTAQQLSSTRKAKSKRKAPEGYATLETITEFSEVQSLPSMHNAKPAGVTCLDLSSDGSILVTGGNDKNVQVYDRTNGKVLASLKGHTKRITRVAMSGSKNEQVGGGDEVQLPEHVVSASEDGKVKVWTQADSTGAKAQAYALSQTVETHKAEVRGLDIHPSGAFFGSASKDGTWALHSVKDGEPLLVVEEAGSGDGSKGGYVYESFAFHPDGQLVAIGTAEGAVRIWDIKSAENVSTFEAGVSGRVSSLHFSENGYYLAIASDESNLVEVWDLRKLSVAGSITVDGAAKSGISAVRFDPTIQFLAVASESIDVYANKSWNHLTTIPLNKAITDLRWDHRDGQIVASCLDRTVRSFGISS